MARYYFHLANGDAIRDLEGAEFSDLWAAQLQAARIFGEMLKEYPDRGWSADPWRLDVCDARGLILFSLSVLTIIGAASPRTVG